MRNVFTPGQSDPQSHSVTLISRVDCHLCEVAEAELDALQRELGFSLEKLDVDAEPSLRAEYSDRVPVFLIDGREHGYWRLEQKRFRAALQR
jgi:glutaredoxin